MTDEMVCELVSWVEVQHLCDKLVLQVKASGYRPEIIVAIARGGYVPARLVCDGLDIMALTSIKIEHYLAGSMKQAAAVVRYPLATDIRDKRVLIVDDVNDSGETLALATDHLRAGHPREMRSAVMHYKTVSTFAVDYYAKKVVKWRWLIYPWAVTEDIGNFLRRLAPELPSPEEAGRLLAQHYGLRISRQRLARIYSLLDSRA